MSHLLAISVGPVQEFIAAARRTRDLWFGSHLLSEISRAVAKSVEENGGKLIFPASSDAENVANVILAELPSGKPRDVAANAEQAAQDRWLKLADDANCAAGALIREDIWNHQVQDVNEFYAAWVRRTDQYQHDRQRLMRLLAGRKNCRDFQASPINVALPKSSLDGQRETVLKELDSERRQQSRMLRLRLSSGEQLDVVGLTKRLGGGRRPYPSVLRIAADPWVRGNANNPRFTHLIESLRELPGDVLIRIDEKQFPQYRRFPYEGVAVYRNRHAQWAEETDITPEQLQRVQQSLDKLPEPDPYLAILIADGDKMGAAISGLDSPDKHREFSQTLAGFADEARKIVEKHHGVLVYAGGDDVLAFLPVDQCLLCARKLHDDFGQRLGKYGTPTLSVGVAIVHCMENLEDILEYGRAAEKDAKKPDRDGLAVHLHKRGGAPVGVRARWSDNPDRRLQRFANLMNDGIIPTKLPYELRAMARLYESWNHNADAAIQHDLYRVIRKKTSRKSVSVPAALSEFIQEMNSSKLMSLARELLIARQIAVALRQAATQSSSRNEVPA